jgi:hypothetical protein
MDAPDRVQAIVADLMAQAQMPERVVRARAELARDPGYWRGIESGLSIGNPPPVSPGMMSTAALDDARAHFAAEGYFQTPPLIAPSDLARLNHAIDAVVAAGWPPVFAWIYDEFWALTRLPDIAALVSSQLGAGYSQIPHIWTHVVPAIVGSAGWAPHFDGPTLGRVSTWVALTDASLSNGCMHVVARRELAPAFESESPDTGQVRLADALRALQGVRALPTPAGSALGWTFDVLHWGGPCLTAARARRALSMEFIVAGQELPPGEMPLAVDCQFPSFEDRLRMIAIAVVSYEKFEPGLIRYRAVAQQLRA